MEETGQNPSGAHTTELDTDIKERDLARRFNLENLGLLALGVAHDVNNIMTGVLGQVSLVKKMGSGLNEDILDSLHAAENGARQVSLLVRQILNFKESREHTLRLVDLSKVMEDCALLLKAGFGTRGRILLKGNNQPCFIKGEVSSIFQMVTNLAINAIEASPSGSDVELLLRPEIEVSGKSGQAFPESAENSDWCSFQVIDRGCGIPASAQDNVFDLFYTTKSSTGSGIGLAIVKKTAESLGGYVTVNSTEGEGTAFEVFLPKVTEQVKDKNSDRISSSAVQDGIVSRQGIMVVDDEEAVRTVIHKCLEHLGYRVWALSSGEEAIEFYGEHQEDIALIMLDMIMPGMTGDEVFHAIRKLNPEAKVLIASGFVGDSRSKHVLNSGALGLLEKPFSVDELAETVRRSLDKTR